MGSLWLESVTLPDYAPLEKNLNTDVLIVGGGLAGVLCAHRLRELGVDCVLTEAETVCGGVTGHTTAKLTAQHGLIYHALLKRFGRSGARTYLEANLAALERFRALCQHIDCEFEARDSYVYALDDPKALEEEISALRALDFPATLERQLPLPFPVAGAVRFPDQAQFHPVKFVRGLLPGLTVYEHSPVRKIRSGYALTDRGAVITAKHILICTHFPMLSRHGGYFLKLYQHRSYLLALEGAPDLPGMYVDNAQSGLTFRSCGPYLLFGGGDHRTGKPGGGWSQLETLARRYWPRAQVKYRWSTQDCMSLDGMPYIGPYSPSAPGLYVATGFNKWGMTGAMVAALLLGDLVTGQQSPWAELFSPARSMLCPQLWANLASSAVGLLTPTRPRCPHMGCALKWNRREHSWDCPCHGSRFRADGQLINGPAQEGLSKP